MGILKIISNIDKATETLDKMANMFEPKAKEPAKPLSIEERERKVKARIKEKGLQAMFNDIYPDP